MRCCSLAALGVRVERTYVDHGLTGTNRDRPGLRDALAACRSGDTLVVTKLDRLARSLPDARDILEDSLADIDVPDSGGLAVALNNVTEANRSDVRVRRWVGITQRHPATTG